MGPGSRDRSGGRSTVPTVRRPSRASLPPSARLAIAAGLLALLCALVVSGSSPASAARRVKPSFVVIQTDDQTLDTIRKVMPYTLDLIGGRGMTFERYYVSYPLCCPSRVSLLTGRYAHNHNVRGNIQPNGGYTGFAGRAAGSHNLATWLRAAGYRTIHIGKFLNGYGEAPFDSGTTVPPGWSAWHTVLNVDATHYYYGYALNDDGHLHGPFGDPGSWATREYGARDDPGCPLAPLDGRPCNYETDTLTRIAADELLATPRGRPFYLQLDYTSPHGDYRRPAGPEPAPRHYDIFKGAQLPHDRREGFDEANVRDKPRFIRAAPRLTDEEERQYGVYYSKQLEALRSVDDGVGRLIDVLGYLRRLRDTYVLFLSDNGFFYGEHRLLGGKFLAYEPATHMPLLIRGPGVRRASYNGELVANVDIAPTVLELAGVRADRSIDGRSLVPFLRDPQRRTDRPILFESFVETADVEGNGAVPSRRGGGATASLLAPPKNYAGIRLGRYKFIAWPSGEKELYDLNRDPYELNSLHDVRNLDPIRNFLHRQMLRLRRCAGRRCRREARRLPLTRRAARRRARKRRGIRPSPGVTGIVRR
jgi:N-acetylglucosamine-6-sulfatase